MGELLVRDCEHILRLNPLIATYSSNLILYKNKAMRQSGLFLDDNRDVSQACVTRPLVRDCDIIPINFTNRIKLKCIRFYAFKDI